MGHTPTISDLQKQNEEFNKYIKTCTDNLEKRAKPEEDNFNSMIDSFYNPNSWDRQPMAQGKHFDYKQVSEFSLDGISDVLKSVANAVFSGGKPPDGTLIGDAETVASIAAELSDFEYLALVAATAFITNVLSAFDKGASTEYHSTMESKPLAPGLMLHVWNFGDAFRKTDFFNNQFILENAIDFQLIYSFAQAGMEQDIEYMESHNKEITELENTLIQMQDTLDKKMMDPDVPMEQLDAWQKRIDFGKKSLETYRTEVDKCIQKYKGKS